MNWISVEDELPEPFTTVLFNVPSLAPCPTVIPGYVPSVENIFIGNLTCGAFTLDEVTHWMPLPEPPEECEQ